jgi:glycosyltransferase involved in cell wall biosynthesis
MKIICTPYQWFGTTATAGGETYLLNLCKALQKYGHEITIIAPCEQQYEYENMPVIPQGLPQDVYQTNNELFKRADAVIHQLIGNPYGYNKAHQHKKPNILISHNTSRHYFTNPATCVVYNSHHMASLNLYPNKSTVLQPVINYRDYKRSKGRKIALINCNENKGGLQLIELAKELPQYQFLAIKGGYGEQITANLPNLEYRENGIIPWNEIGILIVPSETESWSQVATEAICCGIPVLASDLHGLRENLSRAGLYIPVNNVNLYRDHIILLMENNELYKKTATLCYDRAKELDPLPRMDAFNEWLEAIVK